MGSLMEISKVLKCLLIELSLMKLSPNDALQTSDHNGFNGNLNISCYQD